MFYKRPNYQRGVLLISAGAFGGHFEGKSRREIPQGILILHVNLTPRWALAIQKELAYLGFQYLDYPPYSPYLAPSENHLFPGLKKQLKVSHFSSEAKFVADAATWLDGQISDFF